MKTIKIELTEEEVVALINDDIYNGLFSDVHDAFVEKLKLKLVELKEDSNEK